MSWATSTWPNDSRPSQFLYIPSTITDPPTGTPLLLPNSVPAIWDSISESLWIYQDGTWIELGGGAGGSTFKIFSVPTDDTREVTPDMVGWLRMLLVGLSEADLDGPCLQACNGSSWFTIAYLNPRPRLHGTEAHDSTVSGGGSSSRIKVRKDADLARINAIAADDPDLRIPVSAGVIYQFEFRLFVTGDPGGDIIWGVTGPGTNGRYGYTAVPQSDATGISTYDAARLRPNTSNDYSWTTSAPFQNGTVGTGTIIPIHCWGELTTTSAGFITLRWAQRVTTNNIATATTMKRFSHGVAEPFA